MTIGRRGLQVKVMGQGQGQANAVGQTSIEGSFPAFVTATTLRISIENNWSNSTVRLTKTAYFVKFWRDTHPPF